MKILILFIYYHFFSFCSFFSSVPFFLSFSSSALAWEFSHLTSYIAITQQRTAGCSVSLSAHGTYAAHVLLVIGDMGLPYFYKRMCENIMQFPSKKPFQLIYTIFIYAF